MNTPQGNVVTTAEHAIALMFALARKSPRPAPPPRTAPGRRPVLAAEYGKTLGIVGLGNIGKVVADQARGLRMRVIAADPWIKAEQAQALGVELVDVTSLLRAADIVTLHVPVVRARTSA